MRRAISSRSTTSSSTTRVPICVPTRSRSRTLPPRCCPAPIGFPRIGLSAGSGSPTRRRAALIGRRAGSRARSRASVSWTRSRPRPASMRQRRAAGERVGAGLAMFVEKSGLGPSDTVRISVDPTGAVEVVTGVASVGQGVETAIAQICADALGVDYARVRVVHGQTDRIAQGSGAFASRVTVMTGEATRIAATALREQAITAAAELLQAPASSLDISDGEIFRADGKAGPSIELGEVARVLAASRSHSDASPALAAEGTFRTDHMTYPYGVHIAVVRVDGDTGGVKVERYFVAYDIGKAVNPMLIEGQLAGGAVQGLGGALFEEFVYDERGEPLAVTFADYLIPTAHEVPPIEVMITEDAPSPLNFLGLKGAGEGGANAVGAAIAAAIDDAIGIPGAVTELPVTPQRLRRILLGCHSGSREAAIRHP